MSQPWAYYNEIDPYAAQWLRNLIQAGHIAPGYVDTRSIVDVRPYDLREFTQCHFFAGIGVWSHALRGAGWPDDRRVWTGSCPCQPFSTAGKGGGFDDERHLWPFWYHLIEQLRPAIVLGEQVAAKNVDPWIDLVQDDMEEMGHAFAAVPFPAASVGAWHIRDRLYWVAHSGHYRRAQAGQCVASAWCDGVVGDRAARVLAYGGGAGLEEFGEQLAWGERPAVERGGAACVVGHADEGRGGRDTGAISRAQGSVAGGVRSVADGAQPAGPVGGFWADAEWIYCRDGKWRPVEPGTFPLAHGAPARVGRLRAYGNAIVGPQAQLFVETVMEALQ